MKPTETQIEIVDEKGLTVAQQTAAMELFKQHPSLENAFREFHEAYGAAIGKLKGVIIELRKAQLAPREQTVVLKAAGFNEQRASEIKRVVNDTDANYSAYLNEGLSFRLALANARAPLPARPAQLVDKAPQRDSLTVEALQDAISKLLSFYKAKDGASYTLTLHGVHVHVVFEAHDKKKKISREGKKPKRAQAALVSAT